MDVTHTTLAGFPATFAPAQGHKRGVVAFLHGAFGDHSSFAGWQARFSAAGFDAWAASRRGRRGVPPANAEGVTFDDYLADTRAVLDALGEPAILVGHSLGGLLAQVLAAEDRAAAAVLVAPAPPGMLTAQPVALPVFVPNLPRILTGRSFSVPAGGCARIALNEVPADQRAAIHAQLTPESGLVYRALMFGSIRVDAARVRCPVLVLGGERDRIVSVGLMQSTAAHYKAPLELYPNHAHWILEEPGWEVVCDKAIHWTTRHVAAPGLTAAG